MIITTATLIITSYVTGGVVGIVCGYPIAKTTAKKVSKYIEIQKFKKKMKTLIDEIEDKDPDAIHNLILITDPYIYQEDNTGYLEEAEPDHVAL